MFCRWLCLILSLGSDQVWSQELTLTHHLTLQIISEIQQIHNRVMWPCDDCSIQSFWTNQWAEWIKIKHWIISLNHFILFGILKISKHIYNWIYVIYVNEFAYMQIQGLESILKLTPEAKSLHTPKTEAVHTPCFNMLIANLFIIIGVKIKAKNNLFQLFFFFQVIVGPKTYIWFLELLFCSSWSYRVTVGVTADFLSARAGSSVCLSHQQEASDSHWMLFPVYLRFLRY